MRNDDDDGVMGWKREGERVETSKTNYNEIRIRSFASINVVFVSVKNKNGEKRNVKW